MKTCTKCAQEKPKEDFGKWKGSSDGLKTRCKVCLCLEARTYRKNNPVKARDAWKRWAEKHPLREKNRIRKYLSRRVGVEDRFEEVEKRRVGPCDICGGLPKKVVHSLDHDHETGEFRGVLCRACNTLLGMAKDSTRTLKRAIDYLNPPGLAKVAHINGTKVN